MKDQITYYQVGKTLATKVASFVVLQNYEHHQQTIDRTKLEKEITALSDNDEHIKFSKTFVAILNQKICGSIRIYKKTENIKLPIEKLFEIDPEKIVEPNSTIYHIGRFAVKKGADERGFRIFKTLMALALNEVNLSEKSAVFAECDSKLLRILKIVHIYPEPIGNPINYLGSETIPVLLKPSGFERFLEIHQHLIEQNLPLLRDENVICE